MLLLLLWLCGPASLPLSQRLWKSSLPDAGLAAGRVLLLAAWTMTALWLGNFGVSVRGSALLIFPVVALGICAGWWQRDTLRSALRLQWRALLLSEALFFGAFAFFLLVRGFAPGTSDGEKPMDMALISALARAQYLPPANPYAAGLRLDTYYYLGHLQAALLTDATFSTPRWTYNLLCAALPALTFSSLYSLCAALCGRLRFGVFAALLVLCCGTLEPLRLWLSSFFGAPLDARPYFATTRVIPFTINEYPFFSFAFGDLHAHVFALPLMVLVMSLAWALWRNGVSTLLVVTGALALAALLATNSWNFPLCGLLMVLALWRNRPTKQSALAALAVLLLAVILAFPFWSHLRSGVVTLHFLTKPALDPLPWLLVWGVIVGAWCVIFFQFFKRTEKPREYSFLCHLAFCGVLALLWCELFWSGFLAAPFERQDTVFKFGLQAWMLLGTAAACGMMRPEVSRWRGARLLIGLVLALSLFSSALAVQGRTRNFQSFIGFDAWQHLSLRERQAAQWLCENARDGDALFEAEKRDGGDYTEYSRYAHATGIPAVIGPRAHSYQWIGNWNEVFARKDATRALYTSGDALLQLAVLRTYRVRWVVIGELERREYGVSACAKLESLLPVAVRFGALNDPHRVTICHNPQR